MSGHGSPMESEPKDQHLRHFERQLAEHGRASLERSRATLLQRLAEHELKLTQAQDAAGYTSSIEREIRNFREQIAAITAILERIP